MAAAAANAVLDIVENERLSDRARVVGAHFQKRLKERFAQLEIVGEVRGVGLLGAIEFVADRQSKRRFDAQLKVGARISKAARDRGLIARAMPHGDILGFAPPLVVSEAEIDEIVELAYRATKQVMDELAKDAAMA
ncbi:aminotransferase class III-fold pyridoxal phosphate-dependent enzyme [Bradyrhizobium japonicum]